MTETIEVRYKPVIIDGINVYHKYILYTNSEGQQYYARGGPGYFGPGAAQGGTEEASYSFAGNIKTESGLYEPDTVDWDAARDPINPSSDNPHPSETISTGDDLSSSWNDIKDAIRDIDLEDHPYDAHNNSNTTVDQALTRAGLPEPTQDGVGDNFSPGSGNDFFDTSHLPEWTKIHPDPNKDIPGDANRNGIPDIHETINPETKSWWERAVAFVNPPRRDPLTFDLDGDGLETSGINDDNPILFDHDGDGVKNGTGWVDADDAFLVLDKDGNGTIDNGRELFGDSTIKSDGTTAADGFDALADLDVNADGVVNADDAEFENLRLWRDLNQDGLSQEGELFTLADEGVIGINVAATENSQVLPNGNQLADTGTFIKSDGSTGAVGEVIGDLGDIDLVSDTFSREFTDTLDTSAVDQLPDMQGSGAIRDLREAATQSSSLESLLTQFSSETTRDGQLAVIDDLLDAWADTSGFAESYQERITDDVYTTSNGEEIPYAVRYLSFGDVRREYEIETSTGTTVLVQNSYSGGGLPEPLDDTDNDYLSDRFKQLIAEWDQKIHIIEAFNGAYFFGSPQQPTDGARTGLSFTAVDETTGGGGGGGTWTAPPFRRVGLSYTQQQLDLLQESYDAIKSSVYNSLLLQTRFKPLLDSIDLAFSENGISLDFTQVESAFDQEIEADAEAGIVNLIEFNNSTKAMLAGTNWNGTSILADALEEVEITPTLLEVLVELNAMAVGEEGYIAGGTSGDDLVIGSEVANVISASTGDDTIIGLAGNDTLSGSTGDDTLLGGAGNDNLYAYHSSYISSGVGADVLEGGTGSDKLYGDHGSDTYRYNLGDGSDTIYEAGTGSDTVLLGSGIAVSDVTLGRSGYHLLIQFANAGDRILVANYYSGSTSTQIESIEFADGTVWDSAKIYQDGLVLTGTIESDTLQGIVGDETIIGLAGNDTLSGSTGDDTLLGGAGNDNLYAYHSSYISSGVGADVLEGGAGSDKLYGDHGSDTYRYNLGDGSDTIYEAGTGSDTVLLGSGIAVSDVTLGRSGYHLLIQFANAGDRILVANYYSGSTSTQIESIEFADGTVWDSAKIYQDGLVLTGTIESDTLQGIAGDDTIIGLAGNDTLSGSTGDDTLLGGAGNDNLYAYASSYISSGVGADVLEGGTGSDKLYGDHGSDTYRYNLGDGSDTIYEAGTGSDTVLLGSGIAVSDVTLGRSGYHLLIQFANAGDRILVANYYSGSTSTQIESIEFADGTVWDSAKIDYLSNNEAPELGDLIEDQSGIEDTLFSFSIPESTFTDPGDSLSFSVTLLDGNPLPSWLSFDAATNTLSGTPTNADVADISLSVTATDLAGASASQVFSLAIDVDPITGTDADDVLVGDIGNNLIDGGLGNDTLYGGAGNDTIIGGEGNDIINGQTGSDAMSGGAGNDVYVVDDAGDTVTELANEGDNDRINSTISYTLGDNIERLTLTGNADINGTGNDLNNVVVGNTGANNIDGGLGNDTLYGGAGNDILSGGEGNDILNGQTGNNLLYGGLGADRLIAGVDNDLFIAGEGNEVITTGAGYDVISFNLGDGQDTVQSSTDADNTLSLGGNFTYSDLSLTKAGNHLVLKVGETDQVTLQNWYAGSGNQSIANLQVIAEAMDSFALGGTNQLLDNKVESFDFAALVAAFDAAGQQSNWQLTDTLLTNHLQTGSDSAAVGGDIAYQYGLNGNLTGMGTHHAQSVISNTSFGQSAQALNDPSTWADETVKLA